MPSEKAKQGRARGWRVLWERRGAPGTLALSHRQPIEMSNLHRHPFHSHSPLLTRCPPARHCSHHASRPARSSLHTRCRACSGTWCTRRRTAMDRMRAGHNSHNRSRPPSAMCMPVHVALSASAHPCHQEEQPAQEGVRTRRTCTLCSGSSCSGRWRGQDRSQPRTKHSSNPRVAQRRTPQHRSHTLDTLNARERRLAAR